MSGLEVNKILASIIFALILVKVIGHIGDFIVNIAMTKLSNLVVRNAGK